MGSRQLVEESGSPPSTSTMDKVIEASELFRRFGTVLALDGISLSVRQGEIFGILGHNGAGKTTLLRLINGLLRPTLGSVLTFGESAYEAGARIRRRTGVVTESTALDDFLSIRESLVAYGTMCGYPRHLINGRVEELLVAFELEEQADRQVRQLSAGMRQRAAFARGLVHEPELLLLDEPTANMDPVAARQVRDLVGRLARSTGCTVLLSTHNLIEAQGICDRVAVMQHGRIQAVGTIAELRHIAGAGQRRVTIRTEVVAVRRAAEVASGLGRPEPTSQADTIVVDRNHETTVPNLVAALVASDVPVHGISEVEPTLEDIYLALHQQRRASEGSAR